MTDIRDIIKAGCSELDIEIDNIHVEKLVKYKDLLIEWNKKMNLTAIKDDEEIAIKHFLDSLACLKVKGLVEGKLIDIGTGAGFPGIPIKILKDDIKTTLLDALNKRLEFLKEVCRHLDLTDVEYLHGRAEDYGRDEAFRENFDFAVARAVAPLNVLVEYCLPFVRVGGLFICQKGPNLNEELKEAEAAINILGGRLVEDLIIKLPFMDIKHRIIVIEKNKQTPTKYPRRAGKPSKNPIK
ncbi:16S rRNA (guanine(527)-N(7))-methyltransferase RsmG [Alkaliphilus pronyensis]|uniref:Ribosomal RNA small subunit methyltransferase G n=1 Tax=Alkaliphilus pronyensis TaxID=1482732 RepID=A0A6I0EYI6_9FIRM|nr:16S rRNA (guanine(527)-N(7))-methyltransferase RsmG [Alkaliphilus pronyensis]KAB3533837.1 16S rRNA (guanine(527)-N(7))-methyltransferase RsmG [Alkaliphilus pronyensis]